MELGKLFRAEELNVQGYSISEMRKKAVTGESLKDKADFDIDQQYLADIIDNKGKVYAYYDKQKKVVAIYPCPRKGDEISCDRRSVSSTLEEDIIAKFDDQIRFLVAQRASYDTKYKASFLGEDLPKLNQKSEGYNWGMAIVFAMLYSTVFCSAMKGPAGIGVGICLGFCMGLCFTSHKYYYGDTPEVPESKDKAKSE